MPVSWNAFMDQRLLVAVLAAVKLDTALVVTKWQEFFGREDIEQPTQRAIVEHIGKLKKSLGISGSKSSATTNGVKKEPKSQKSPTSKKQKVTFAPLTPPGSAGHDDDKQIGLNEDGQAAQTPAKKPANSRTPKGMSASKRQRDDTTDEEGPMTEGDGDDDKDPVAQLPAIKSEDDEFFMPGEPTSNEICVPARSQRPRRAKAERKPILLNEDTTDEEEDWDVVDEEEAQDEIKQEEAAMEEALQIPSPRLPPGVDCIVVANQRAD